MTISAEARALLCISEGSTHIAGSKLHAEAIWWSASEIAPSARKTNVTSACSRRTFARTAIQRSSACGPSQAEDSVRLEIRAKTALGAEFEIWTIQLRS